MKNVYFYLYLYSEGPERRWANFNVDFNFNPESESGYRIPSTPAGYRIPTSESGYRLLTWDSGLGR